MVPAQPRVFVSYSHEDEAWKDRIVRHLRVLELQGDLVLWDDRRIRAGEDWHPAIEGALASARIALLLVSANSLTSQFILDSEVPALLRRRATEGLELIPVILRPCAWQEVPWLASIQAVPRDGRPLSTLQEHEVDAELASLARDVRRGFGRGDRNTPASGSPVTVPSVSAAPPPAVAVDQPNSAEPLEDYEVLKVIHTGHYGRVLKCRIRTSGEVCIVKETDADHVSRRALARLAEIGCPNVAAARRIWSSDGMLYEELPYIGGLSLDGIVEPGVGGLAGSILESFQSQVDRVLATVHRAGIVHRDVHPSNVYLVVKSPDEVANVDVRDVTSSWIFDAFGRGDDAFLVAWILVDSTLAILADDVAQLGYRHGAFTPPEQEAGGATTASDMYAFGATMYYGICGNEPPTAQNRQVNPRAKLEIPDVRHPSRDFPSYLAQLLSLSPEERASAGFPLREETIASGYCGTLRLGQGEFLIVDSFPDETVRVDREGALRFHRERYSQPWAKNQRPHHEYWIKRLS